MGEEQVVVAGQASRWGPCIYTLLSGKALEAIERMEPEAYQKKEGGAVLLALLGKRLPQLDVVGELG